MKLLLVGEVVGKGSLKNFMPLVENYSYLKASTGFRVAAFQLCQLTVSSAIPNANIPANAKIHYPDSVSSM